MITLDQYLMGRKEGLTPDLLKNAQDTINKVNRLLQLFGSTRKVTSGYRPAAINAAVGGAKRSKHMLCKACDLEDRDGKLDAWCYDNQPKLAEIGLWLEHPSATPGWCHIQTVPPKSGVRVFRP